MPELAEALSFTITTSAVAFVIGWAVGGFNTLGRR